MEDPLHDISFQSRNRGTFGFKVMKIRSDKSEITEFHLVIEVLLVSRLIY